MELKLDTLTLKSYDSNCDKHTRYKNSLEYDDDFVKYFGHFFIKNIDDIFVASDTLEVNKAYILEDNDEVIGMIRIFKKTFNGVIELQYAVSKEYRKNGYGIKILKEMSNYFMSIKDINCIKLDIDKNNIGSITCATSLGYIKDDSETYKRTK